MGRRDGSDWRGAQGVEPAYQALRRPWKPADEIDPDWLEGRRRIGVTAGASAPDVLVEGVLARLQSLGARGVRELAGEPEDMVFALPKELRVQLVD